MATGGARRRLSFVDLAHPQAWNKLLEYTEMTIAFTKLITDFSNQWAKICMLASSQLQQLVHDFRRKTESELRGKCQLGGMMYDLWESLLLESEIESQSLKKVANVLEREVSGSLINFITNKKCQIAIHREHLRDLDEILATSHEIVQESRDEYATIYNTQGLTSDCDLAHNQYILELTAGNSLSSKYQMNILPQLLQGMEQSQLETIETICQNIHNIASILQEYHEQRHSSFASFVVTSTTTNPNQELENYICSMNGSNDEATSSPAAHLQYHSFVSPLNTNSRSPHISSVHNDPLIVYTTPVVQMQLATRSKETTDRLKELKKEKSVLLSVINPPSTKIPVKQQDDQQQSGKKQRHQMNDSMKKKHQLRLIELEEAILIAQQDLLKTRQPSMTSSADNDRDAQKRNNKTTKGLWRDAFRALKTPSNASGTPDEQNRPSFVRRISARRKKHSSDREREREREREEDQVIIDPVYETLKVAAETRKRTVAHYLQQRQQTLNKQTSLNSQSSSEPDIQPSPRVVRQSNATLSSHPEASSSPPSDNARIFNY